MDFSRRDLLKFFGAGALIVPASGVAPLARLIEVPKVEIVEATKIPEALDMSQVKSVSITFEMQDGTRRAIRTERLWGSVGEIDSSCTILNLRVSKLNGSSPNSALAQGAVAASVVLL